MTPSMVLILMFLFGSLFFGIAGVLISSTLLTFVAGLCTGLLAWAMTAYSESKRPD